MSYLGRQVRLNRIMSARPNRLLDITVDHAIARGVIPGLENIASLIARLIEGKPDAITMHKGIAESCFMPYAGQIPLIIKCSSYSPFHHSFDTPITSVEEAVRLGADGVSIGVIVGDSRQPEALTNLGTFVREARLMGMPTIAHIYPNGDLIPDDQRTSVENVQYAARVAAEVGIDIVKTLYTGSSESFARVVESCPALVVAAGGIEAEDARGFLQKARDVIDAGGAGFACGRFVWNYRDPLRLINALKHVIHHDGSVDRAMAILEG
jgi:fructose-bisphosphate aldolase, class I